LWEFKISKIMGRQERLSLMSAWETSNQTKKAYCESKRIRYGTFIYWFQEEKRIKKDGESGSFVAIKKEQPLELVQEGIEVVLPNGIRLLGLSQLDLSTLKMLAHV